MKYEVYTTIQARILVDADSETKAMEIAEVAAKEATLRGLTVSGQVIAGAREADEVQ